MNSTPSPSSDFDKVELGTFLKSACSPHYADRTAVGIQIRMPERVSVPASGDARLPLCLTAQLTAAEVNQYRHVFEPANVVLIDDERGETLSGSLWKDRTFREPPPLEMSAEEMKTVTLASYYNVNVMERLDIPRRKAKYRVFVTLNDHKSNVCTLEVEVK